MRAQNIFPRNKNIFTANYLLGLFANFHPNFIKHRRHSQLILNLIIQSSESFNSRPALFDGRQGIVQTKIIKIIAQLLIRRIIFAPEL